MLSQTVVEFNQAKTNQNGKWADYLISAVRYEECGTTRNISHVRVHIDGDKVGVATTWTRQEVITAIGKGRTFVSIVKTLLLKSGILAKM